MMLPLVAAALAVAPCQTPSKNLGFEVAEGTNVSLFAESPMLFNPTAMAMDDAGRLWVSEGVNYRQWDGKNPGLHRDGGDRIVVLIDEDQDGRADRSQVFVQDPDLTAPLGIAVVGGSVYVSCSPNLFVYHDRNGDLVADEREVLLTGFGGHDHDHGLHSVVAHPDGDLLWCVGNAGPHVVTDQGGFHLRSGSIYNGGGASNPGNRPGLVSDDGRVWTGGLIGSLRPDGTGMRVLAHNFRNEYEVAVDSFGTLYTFDNDDDGNQGCRAVALLEGGNYGYFSADGGRMWDLDRRPGQTTLEAHWHQGDPGVMPAGTMTGGGGPTGVTVYEAEAFPEWTGALLAADAGRSLVFAMHPVIRGAQVVLEPEILIQPAADADGQRGRLFRPSDVAVGNGGEIYVADWFDPGVGGHWAGDREAYGRILVLRPEPGTRSAQVRTEAAQRGAMVAFGRRIWQQERSGELRGDLAAVLAGPLKFAMAQDDPHVRITALRACLRAGQPAASVAAAFAKDPSAWVRASAAASVRDEAWEQAAKPLLDLALGYDGSDRQYLEAVGLGASGKEGELYRALLERLDPDRDQAKLLHWAWRLHPSESLALLQGWASNASLPWPSRRMAIDGLAQLPEREAAEFVVSQALAGPADAREYAAEWVRQRSDTLWNAYGLKQSLVGEFARAEPLCRSELVRTEPVPIEVDLRGIEILWLVVEDGGNGNGYDWAVWEAPTVVTADGEVPLESLAMSNVQTGWGETRWNRSADGRAITVGGEAVAYGLGTHAPARAAFVLPAGAVALHTTCAPDDGGAQGGQTPTIRFAIYGERRPDREAQVRLQQAATAGDLDAAQALVGTLDGALFLLEQARNDALPKSVRSAVEGPLQQHADLSVRALASEVFPLVATDGQALPPINELAAMHGDVARGRELFRGRATCVACHRFEGLGGAIGPDLSAIGQKYDRKGILDSLLHPSASLAFGYDNWSLVLQNGDHLAGAILADGDSIVLRDLAGKRHVVAASDVQSRHKSAVSTMPSALALGLGAQDLVDVAAFLTDDPNRDRTPGEPIELFNGRDLSGWNFFLNSGGQRDDVWSVEDGILRCKGNPTGYLYTQEAYTNFELVVEWRFDPATGGGNSGVLLRVQPPHLTWPHSIEAQLESGSAGDIWNIDGFPMRTDPARTSGRRTEKLLPSNERPLGEWNQYRIRLVGSHLTLEVNGQVQNTASWCEEIPGAIALQSEGVPIEFRRVTLRRL